MPNYTYICLNCKNEQVERVSIDMRDSGLDVACEECGQTDWMRKHCEAQYFDTFFSHSHRNQYGKYKPLGEK